MRKVQEIVVWIKTGEYKILVYGGVTIEYQQSKPFIVRLTLN